MKGQDEPLSHHLKNPYIAVFGLFGAIKSATNGVIFYHCIIEFIR